MSEREKGLYSLRPNSRERKLIEKRLAFARQMDIKRGYTIDRNSRGYIGNLFGLSATFGYVRSLSSQTIVDIGAGTTRGIHEISQLPSAQGLEFQATVLTPERVSHNALPSNKIHVTSVEALDGFQDESVGAFLGVDSIGYSASPRIAVKRINEALVKGGVLKASFSRNVPNMSGYLEFGKELKGLGYDMYGMMETHMFSETLLAIKPGGAKAVKAKDISTKDAYGSSDQHDERNQAMANKNRQYLLDALAKHEPLPAAFKDAVIKYGYILFLGKLDIDYLLTYEHEPRSLNAYDDRDDMAMGEVAEALHRKISFADAGQRPLNEDDLEKIKIQLIGWAISEENLPGVIEFKFPTPEASAFREIASDIPLIIDLQRDLVNVLWTNN